MNLSDSVQHLSGVGTATAKTLSKLGIFNIGDLLGHFPYRYEDLSKITEIQNVRPGGDYVIRARIVSKKAKPAFRFRQGMLEALIEDGTGSLAIIWFNQAYLNDILTVDKTYLFAGPVTFYKALQMQNPVWELDKPATVHVGCIVPIYPMTAGIYAKRLRSLLKLALDKVPKFEEFLPEPIIKSVKLLDYDKAIRSVHFPGNLEELGAAKKRLAFDELFLHELKILANKKKLQRLKGISIPFPQEPIKKFVSSLPFTLTPSQKISAWEIMRDLQKDHPANRLLSGDVGSGKTVVAALAALQTILAGHNVAIMVPTEILARQHFESFASLPFAKKLPIICLTSTGASVLVDGELTLMKKKLLLATLEKLQSYIIIGTHSLIQKDLNLRQLGLVIVDEQHRFGVQQRAYLQESAKKEAYCPHFLSMTATPIPRTLALSLYGDLDISSITELPKGRKPVKTLVITPDHRPEAYAAVKKEASAGRQIFVVCPLIDPSDTLGVKSATEEFERLKKTVFPRLRLGLLHGKLKSAEKEKVISAFGLGELDILVSTTVVEVGVNFPNATVMMIEGAERFGLAQLHQLRGRVGRSDFQSYCFLLPSAISEKTKVRLDAMETCQNGLELSEIDLKLRGPGEAYGNLQSGYPQFQMADIFDFELLKAARDSAQSLLDAGDLNKYPLLVQKIRKGSQRVHLE